MREFGMTEFEGYARFWNGGEREFARFRYDAVKFIKPLRAFHHQAFDARLR